MPFNAYQAAMLICKKWWHRYNRLPDAVVVEGPKVGGHLGFKTEQLDDPAYVLEKLVPQVIAAVATFEKENGKTIPVIAAGGIFTGKDIHRFLEMGAAEKDIVVIKSPVGMPGRAIRNPFLEAVKKGARNPSKCPYHCIRTCDPEKSPYCIAMALTNALKGKFAYGFAFAGENAHRVKEIVPVKVLMDELMQEYETAVRSQQLN